MKKIVLLIILIIPIYFIFSYNSFKGSVITKEDQVLEIKKWDNYRDLASKFGLNSNYLKIYLKLNPPNKSLFAWTYKLKSWLNISQVIESIKNPITNDIKITFLEWWNIYDLDDKLTKNNLIKSWELIRLSNENLIDYKDEYNFLKKVTTLEGFLYPDTYSINPNNFKLEDLVKTMLTNFDKKVIKELDVNPEDTDLLDNIILASIVEKEEKSIKEKSTVAWVLKKRLQEKWFIWADATVCYPHKLTFDECTPKFIVNHIDDTNEYNTRNKLWLPKTPICNPSNDSIEAVYNTKNTPYYYYLHDSSWQIHYARTNEEHVANKMLYIKN